MTETPRRERRRPTTLQRRITGWIAGAWPEDESDRMLARMTAEAIGRGEESRIEEAQYALDKESAKAVLETAFLLGNLAAGLILGVTVLTRGALDGFVAFETVAIVAAQGPSVWLWTREGEWTRWTGRWALLFGTGIGIGLVL